MKKPLAYISLLLVPSIAFAQTGLNTVIEKVGGLINSIVPLIIAIAVIGFLWGLAMFIFKAGNDEEQKKARSIMIWGILAIFVMVSVWGLVSVLQSTFSGTDIKDKNTPVDPPKAFEKAKQ